MCASRAPRWRSRCACVRADRCACQPHIVLLQLKSVSLRMCASSAPLWCSRCACVRSNCFEINNILSGSARVRSNGLETMSGHSRCACVHSNAFPGQREVSTIWRRDDFNWNHNFLKLFGQARWNIQNHLKSVSLRMCAFKCASDILAAHVCVQIVLMSDSNVPLFACASRAFKKWWFQLKS